MKLFTPNDIQAVKAKERKLEIDQGMRLALRVDNLRTALATEEKNLHNFRTSTVPLVQKEINGLLEQLREKKDELALLQKQCEEARKPLDAEWVKLRTGLVDYEAKLTYLSNQTRDLNDWEASLRKEQGLADQTREDIKQARSEVTQAQKEVRKLHIQKEGELAETQKLKHNLEEEYSQKLKIVDEKERKLDYDIEHYKDFTSSLKEKEHALSQRETQLTIRENAKRKN